MKKVLPLTATLLPLQVRLVLHRQSAGFYKYFENLIEKQLFPVLNRKFTYLNTPSAYAMGIEVEFRLEWKSLIENLNTPLLKDVTVVSNLAQIKARFS